MCTCEDCEAGNQCCETLPACDEMLSTSSDTVAECISTASSTCAVVGVVNGTACCEVPAP